METGNELAKTVTAGHSPRKKSGSERSSHAASPTARKGTSRNGAAGRKRPPRRSTRRSTRGQQPPVDSPIYSDAGSPEDVEALSPALSGASPPAETTGSKAGSPYVRSDGVRHLSRKTGDSKSGTTSGSPANVVAKSPSISDAAVAIIKQAAAEGKPPGPVSAALSPVVRRSSLKKPGTAAGSTTGTQKQHSKSVGVRSPSEESAPKIAVAASVEVNSLVLLHTE